MAVRTKRLTEPMVLVPGVQTLAFTCPAGRTAIVKTIQMFNPSAANRTLQVGVNTGSGVVFIDGLTIGPSFGGRIAGLDLVLEEGDELYFLVAGASINAIASGSLLFGNPT